MKKSFFGTLVFLFFILLYGMGEAFVPQAPHLLYLVIEKIKQPVGIEAFQIKKILNYQELDPPFFEFEEKLIYSYPNQFRSEIISNTTTSFSIESDFNFVKVTDGINTSENKSPVDQYNDILLYRDYETLLNQLVRSGVDTKKVVFRRYNDSICYVIGKPIENGKPFASLWIEKETLLPQKYVVEKDEWIVEFFYNNWQRVSKTWYPMQISVFLDRQLFSMIHVKSFDLKAGFSKDLFDIEHIKKVYPKNEIKPFDENERQVEELNKQIEEFKELYE